MEVIKNKNKLFSKSKNLNTFISPVIFLIVFLLVFINKTDLNMISKIRGLSLDIITPISSIVAFPINKTSEFINYAYHIKNLSLENDRLKIENKRLLRWKTLSTRLIDENEAYKQLLNVQDKNLQLQQTVRILTQPSGSFINSIQLNAGKNKDIKINSSVINERGLVGRIIEVGNFSSKVLLINDMNSNIPVKVFNTDINAIITGNSDQKFLKLKFIKENKNLKLGQVLVTNGNAGIFPRNILVGKVYKIDKNGTYILPFVNLRKLNFVQVVSKKNN